MNLLILGANSDVAYATAQQFAANLKADLFLASRDLELLKKKARDLEIRHAVKTRAMAFDAADTATHKAFYENLDPKPDGVVTAFGYLGDQTLAQTDFNEALKLIRTNFVGAASILEIVAADFQRRGHGFIIGISSVAGERGRQSNYFYGAAKGAFSIYLSGLRNRLSKHRVQVITVLPGFIQTKMTHCLTLPALLTARPEQVAADIFAAYRKSKDVVYTRWFWRWIMLVIKAIPESLFKRLSL
jgi:decaprenylphospho-beta-D-erythro-pentofuranosid-2-ulose 2-reductase